MNPYNYVSEGTSLWKVHPFERLKCFRVSMLGIIQRDNDIHRGPNRFCVVWKNLTSVSRSMVAGEG